MDREDGRWRPAQPAHGQAAEEPTAHGITHRQDGMGAVTVMEHLRGPDDARLEIARPPADLPGVDGRPDEVRLVTPVLEQHGLLEREHLDRLEAGTHRIAERADRGADEREPGSDAGAGVEGEDDRQDGLLQLDPVGRPRVDDVLHRGAVRGRGHDRRLEQRAGHVMDTHPHIPRALGVDHQRERVPVLRHGQLVPVRVHGPRDVSPAHRIRCERGRFVGRIAGIHVLGGCLDHRRHQQLADGLRA